jgi:phosphatidylserine/phosphatidylglycerophosphate/cardiolipin synthase-like enzyme
MIGPSLRHTFLVIVLPLATSIAALGIIFSPLFFQRNLQELEWQSTARTKLIGPYGRVKTALFSPDDNIREVLLGLISAESQRIILASYVITDRIVVDELIKCHKRGVKIEVIACRSGAQDQWTKVGLLIEAGIPVYVYPLAFIRSLMHNKFIVFFRSLERMILATGSYNITTSAGKANQENFLFIDDVELARQYITRFEHIKRLAVLIGKNDNLPSKNV